MAKKTSGIYKITNDRTGETYIGQSKNIERRIKSHENELRQGTHHNRGMQADYLNGDTFTYTVLEQTSPNRQTLHQKEENYISQYNSFNEGYNQTPGGQYDKYKGYYGHGGGRQRNNSQQTTSYTRDHNSNPRYYGEPSGFSLDRDEEFLKCGLFVCIVLFGPLLFITILTNTQFINFADDSINYYAFIPIVSYVILVILLLIYIFSDTKLSEISLKNFFKRKNEKIKEKKKNDKRKMEENEKIWKICPQCGYMQFTELIECPKCGKKLKKY